MFKFRKKRLIVFASLVSALLFLASLNPAREPFLNILKHPLSLLTLIRRELGGIIFYHRNYIQNERLKKELGLARNELNTQKETELENARLKEQLSFKKKSPYKVIAARVIARPPDAWSSSIIIDKGRYNGIKRGMAVITHLGLVGRVVATSEATSNILLINAPNLCISAMNQRSRQEGLVCGTLGTYLIMKYLPEDSDTKINDAIITSGLNAGYPKGLLIGNVVEVGKEFSGLSHFALIKPAVKLSDIEEVLIITP